MKRNKGFPYTQRGKMRNLYKGSFPMVNMSNDYKIKEFSSVRKVWLSGTTLVVSIPREVREATELERGDLIKITFTNEVQKRRVQGLTKEEEEVLKLPNFE